MSQRPTVHATTRDRARPGRRARSCWRAWRCSPVSSCRSTRTADSRRFATPEDAVQALIAAASTGNRRATSSRSSAPTGRTLIDTSDAASARRGRQVFAAAAAEGWHLDGSRRRRQDADRRQRRVAVPGAARQGADGLALRHRGRHGGDHHPPHRPQRAGGDRGLRDLRRGATRSMPATSHDGKPVRSLCGGVPQRRRASRTACTGPRRGAASAVRSAICSRSRGGSSAASRAGAASRRRRSTATTSGS